MAGRVARGPVTDAVFAGLAGGPDYTRRPFRRWLKEWVHQGLWRHEQRLRTLPVDPAADADWTDCCRSYTFSAALRTLTRTSPRQARIVETVGRHPDESAAGLIALLAAEGLTWPTPNAYSQAASRAHDAFGWLLIEQVRQVLGADAPSPAAVWSELVQLGLEDYVSRSPDLRQYFAAELDVYRSGPCPPAG